MAGLKFFLSRFSGPLVPAGNKFDLVRSSGDSARTLTPSADVGKVPFAERRHRYPRARTRRAVGRYCYAVQVERIYDYISHPHVPAGGDVWGRCQFRAAQYSMRFSTTRLGCACLTCYCAMLLMASGRLLRAPGFRCVAWRRRVQGFECRAFTNCFVLGFVSRVHVHSRVSPEH